MPISTRYLLVVSMDVAPEKEDLFNEVYDTEHVPALSRVPGVVSVQRFRTREAGDPHRRRPFARSPRRASRPTRRSTRSRARTCW